MPKTDIDYSNTIIYRIFCKDENITDCYVGHTTNFTQRKYAHKLNANGDNNLKIYQFIRENGGWDNWEMNEIARYECKNLYDALEKEQLHYELLKPTLNMIPPCKQNTNAKKIYVCECGSKYHNRQGLWKHAQGCKQSKRFKPINVNQTLVDLVTQMVKQNNEIANLIVDVCKGQQQVLATLIASSQTNFSNFSTKITNNVNENS